MAEQSDDLNRILDNAKARNKYLASSYFEPSPTLIAFGKKVEDWFIKNDQEVTLTKFRGMFITMGVAKLGFRGYVEKIVPKIHTLPEFELLMGELGYDLVGDDEPVVDDEYADNPLRVLVAGSDTFDEISVIGRVIRQFPPSTKFYTNARSEVDVAVTRYCDNYNYECHDVTGNMFRHKDIVLVFHEAPRESEHSMKIALKARDKGIGVKVITGAKKVELDVAELAGR